MSIFRSNSVPYVLAIIVAALGWAFTQLAPEIASTRAASYRITIDEDARTAKLRLTNISRSLPIEQLTFSLVCRERGHCFTKDRADGQTGAYAHFVAVAPVAPTGSNIVSANAELVTFTLTVPAGGSIELVTYLVDAKAEYLFYYLPSENMPANLYLFEGMTVFGFLIKNYIQLLIYGILLSGSFFIVWVVVSIFGIARSSGKEK